MKAASYLVFALVLFTFTAAGYGAESSLPAASLKFEEHSLEIETMVIGGEQFDFISMPGLDLTRQVSLPCLPVKTLSFYIPRGKAVKAIRLESVETATLPGTYTVMPAQPELPLIPGMADEAALPDESVYSSSRPYPPSPVSEAACGYIAGRRIASVRVFPVQYLPAEGEVVLNTDIELVVELMDAVSEAPVPLETEAVRNLRNRAVRALVTNGADVDADFTGGTLDPSAATEYLIISHANHVDEYEALREWKTRKGVPAEILAVPDVLAAYPGRDDAEKIRNCIEDYYLNESTAWVLLTLSAPKAVIRSCRCSVGGTEEDIPCDLYFADMDGDWNDDGDAYWGEVGDDVDLYPDLYVGRSPANTGISAAVIVNKILTYEGFHTYASDYQLEMLFLAEYADAQTDGGIAKDLIDTESVPARFNPIAKLYESSANLDKSTALNALNSGQGFVNHDGHGNNSLISIGPNVLDKEDAEALTNAPRYSVLYTVACHPGNFECLFGCFGRSFIESENGGGFFVGNSRYGWYWPGNPGYGTGELYDREFFKSMFTRNFEHLGVIHADAKAQRAPNSTYNGTDRWTQFTSNLFGCPETPVWLYTPLTLFASHDASIETGTQSFEVYVTNAGSPLSGARVCLYKGSDVYEVDETTGDGLVTFVVSPADSGQMTVTVTKNGYLPYLGTTTVTGADAGVTPGGILPLSMMVLPNPAIGSVRVSYALPGTQPAAGEAASIEIYDARGRLVDSIPVEETTTSHKTITWDGRSRRGSSVPAGIYFLKISSGSETISTKFVFLR